MFDLGKDVAAFVRYAKRLQMAALVSRRTFVHWDEDDALPSLLAFLRIRAEENACRRAKWAAEHCESCGRAGFEPGDVPSVDEDGFEAPPRLHWCGGWVNGGPLICHRSPACGCDCCPVCPQSIRKHVELAELGIAEERCPVGKALDVVFGWRRRAVA